MLLGGCNIITTIVRIIKRRLLAPEPLLQHSVTSPLLINAPYLSVQREKKTEEPKEKEERERRVGVELPWGDVGKAGNDGGF